MESCELGSRTLEEMTRRDENAMNSDPLTRREVLRTGAVACAMTALPRNVMTAQAFTSGRPAAGDRKFTSKAVERTIMEIKGKIADPMLATIFEQCLPNTLDTTVYPGVLDGKPDTYVVTGDIDAMWLRDSSAQVWPYLRFAKQDQELAMLIQGIVRRQGRLVMLDPYANSFMRSAADPPLKWAVGDHTKMTPGVGERKWEIDSLCYVLRLAHGYWQATGDTTVFDAEWKAAAWKIVETFREQQRKHGPGPYSFQRSAFAPSDTVPLGGFGNPAKPLGMIFSMFRPSDDACTYPLFVPANLFAVRALGWLQELPLGDAKLAAECAALAAEVKVVVEEYGTVDHPRFGKIWAYEVDGYGNTLMMDDANAPGLLSLAYLGYCGVDDPQYKRTRAFVLSDANPYFFKGKAAEGVGGPHIGLGYIWPMSITMRALTSTDDREIVACLRALRNTTAGTGFMHESFQQDDPKDFTRSWFAWANTLFGELILDLAARKPALLRERMEA